MQGKGTHIDKHGQDDGPQDQIHVHVHAGYVARRPIKKSKGARFTSEWGSDRGIGPRDPRGQEGVRGRYGDTGMRT